MLRIINITLMAFSVLMSNAWAASNTATIVQFNEREEGIDPYQVRYIFTNDMVRIDDNNDAGDYVIYDDNKRIIYSVNNSDSTILVIKNKKWDMPNFEFQRNVTWKLIEDAPKVESKSVYTYWLSANETICTEAQVVEGLLLKESKMLKRYRQTLSAAQVDSLVATPEDMRTPCLLVDKVYNAGNVYDKGFPLQQWHKDGLQRIMTSYKTEEKYSTKLFELPEKYNRYSIGDNLGFGQP